MNTVEIILIVIGGIILLLGYFLPMKKKGEDMGIPQMSEDRVKELFDREMGEVRSKVDDIVDEAISYAMEKTERAMERLSNEKIMSVNEYSDTVLTSINKNHEAVIFLYDMLNEKHDGLVKVVGEASSAAKDMERILEEAKTSGQDSAESREGSEKKQPIRKIKKAAGKKIEIHESEIEVQGDNIQESESAVDNERKPQEEAGTQEADAESGLDFAGGNNNEKILELHKMGKSKTAIAKELGVGVGEVKLVIGLFESV